MAEKILVYPNFDLLSPARLRVQNCAEVPSAACDAVMSAEHPSPENGGPCATCAFRPGTEANQTAHTVELARLCVEGFKHFHCHEQPQLCRGFIAALNLRGVPQDVDDRNWSIVAGIAADVLGDAVASAREAQDAHEAMRGIVAKARAGR